MSLTYEILRADKAILAQYKPGEKVALCCQGCGQQYWRPLNSVRSDLKRNLKQNFCSAECQLGQPPQPAPGKPKHFSSDQLVAHPELLDPFRSRDTIWFRCVACAQPFGRPKNYVQARLKRHGRVPDVCSQGCEAHETVTCANDDCGQAFRALRREQRQFCSQSCAAVVNNRRFPKRPAEAHPCPMCGDLVKPPNVYCDNFCFRTQAYQKLMERKAAQMRAEMDAGLLADHMAEAHGFGLGKSERANRIVGQFYCEEIIEGRDLMPEG